MSLFAILGIPCLTLFILSTDRQTAAGPRRALPVLQFIKGFLYAIASLVVVLLLRRYISLSHRSFPLYLYFLFTDHLIPVVFLSVLYFLAYFRKNYQELLLFCGGFYTLLAVAELFTHYGQYEPYYLFLLPALRMAGLLFLTIFFLRYQEWYGAVRLLFLILILFVPLLSATVTYLYMRAHLPWASLVTALLFLGSLLYTFLEREV